ncbi:MAG: hypothetical protein AAF467_19830 [Actinomycetota bacterium]
MRQSRRTRRLVAVAMTLVASTVVGIGVLAAPVTVDAQTNAALVVNSTGDQPDTTGTDGQCRTAAGTCTLRAAIAQANYNSGPDTIRFNIAGGGPHTITLGTTLPVINDPRGGVTIDGYTQPGSQPNTSPSAFNAVIRIQIATPAAVEGMIIESAANTVRGLALYGNNEKIELRGESADGNKIIGNIIGSNAASSVASGHTGIVMNLGPDQNEIGTPNLADRNVISGNSSYGIRINHGETSQNFIQNNLIGVGPNGQAQFRQYIGIDMQWWTWGNYIGGLGTNERNVLSGNNGGGGAVDLSHMATGNTVVGNYIGTTVDGNSANANTRNSHGVILKDNPTENVIAYNVIGNSSGSGVWGKHNYTGRNYFRENRIGVSRNGANIANTSWALFVTGHDDIFHGNIISNGPAVYFSNNNGNNASFPAERTVNNQVRLSTYHNLGGRFIEFDALSHPNRSTPRVTAAGPGQVDGDRACAGCTVEVYVSGRRNADGTITPGAGNDGLVAIGMVTANNAGLWSMRSNSIVAGRSVAAIATNAQGEMGGSSNIATVSSSGAGLRAGAPGPNAAPAAPTVPGPPPRYQVDVFECSYANGTLSWENAGANEYYVFATTAGTERYLGGHRGTSLANVAPADSYRVEHWVAGQTNANCSGPGAPAAFACSYANGTLTWANAGAPEYYVFATTAGTERYLGGHRGTSLANVAPADSYRVEHWVSGQTNANCAGPGGTAPASFTCSLNGSTLTWANAGAAEYYVFATIGGTERYLGGHRGTSLANVAPADSYRVEHWVTGSATNTTCQGGGAQVFSCSVSNGTLTWVDAGAPEYYVFAITGGTERYLGGHTGLSLQVGPADRYRVEHWVGGQTNAFCP